MSRYIVHTTKKFEKDLLRCKKRGLNMELIRQIIAALADGCTLPVKYKAHKLSGNYAGCWECHIQPDWLLIWKQYDAELVLLLIDTGTHADLFK